MNLQKTNRFEIKQDDTLPRLETVLIDGEGNPIDLTTALSVELSMTLCGHPRTVVLAQVMADFSPDLTGEVWYDWLPGDTAVTGLYDIEWTVTFVGAVSLTVPSKGYDTVEVTKRL